MNKEEKIDTIIVILAVLGWSLICYLFRFTFKDSMIIVFLGTILFTFLIKFISEIIENKTNNLRDKDDLF